MVLLVLLAIVGAYATALWTLENLIVPGVGILWRSIRLRKKSLRQRYGKWAVITGATDGIGKGYAQQLAAKGMDLVLISRSKEKLVKVCQEIKAATGVEIKLIAVDFSHGVTVFDNIRAELESIDVGILVNNVGMVHSAGLFENVSEQTHLQVINVNILSTLLMTHIVLPKMKIAGRGIIINISSGTAEFPAPYITSYAASKSYGHNLTLALQEELRGTGVECQLVVPGFVRTNMTSTWPLWSIGGMLMPDARQFCSSATWLIGKTDNTSGHWYQALWKTVGKLMPEVIQRRISGALFKHLFSEPEKNEKRTSL
nr:inactive hydroxysteroid dehydrogenase-like protein 1 [Aedes albopictus]